MRPEVTAVEPTIDSPAVDQPSATRGSDRRHTFPGRQRRINLRFGPDEECDIDAAAARCGRTPTGFCAVAALATARQLARPGADKVDGVTQAELAALQRDLFATRTAVGRVGTNLNQAVAQFNTTGEPPVWLGRVVAMCGRALEALDTAASAIHRRLR
jgi:uncharacterized protein (DUF1778 family)